MGHLEDPCSDFDLPDGAITVGVVPSDEALRDLREEVNAPQVGNFIGYP